MATKPSLSRVVQSATLKYREILSSQPEYQLKATPIYVLQTFVPFFFCTLLNISLLEILKAIEANMESFLAAVFNVATPRLPSRVLCRTQED